MKRERDLEVAWYGSPWDSDPPPPPAPPDHLHTGGPCAADAPKDAAALQRVGVVIGRFHPPHMGHLHLVRSAFARCGLLHVLTPLLALDGAAAALILALPEPAWGARARRIGAHALHAAMVRGAFAELARVTGLSLYRPTPSAADPAFAQYWADTVRGAVPNVTTLFSSDDGGGADAVARALGAEHVCIDPRREVVRVSATELRGDVFARFRLLAPGARPMLALNVAVVGAEGAGKSTLARELALLFEAGVAEDALLREAARTGAIPSREAIHASLTNLDSRRADAARRSLQGVVISEDAKLQMFAWMRRLGVATAEAERDAAAEQVDLWLVCHNDFPFQGPPERDDPAARAAFFEDLVALIGANEGRRQHMVHVRGEGAERVDLAAAAVRAALDQKRARAAELLS